METLVKIIRPELAEFIKSVRSDGYLVVVYDFNNEILFEITLTMLVIRLKEILYLEYNFVITSSVKNVVVYKYDDKGFLMENIIYSSDLFLEKDEFTECIETKGVLSAVERLIELEYIKDPS